MSMYLAVWISFGNNTYFKYLNFISDERNQFTVKASQVMSYCYLL